MQLLMERSLEEYGFLYLNSQAGPGLREAFMLVMNKNART
jgi:hypothetical protein